MNPPGSDRDLGAVRGWKRGGGTDAGNNGKHRHAAQGVETSGGGWRVVGMGNSQMDDALLWERMLGAVIKKGVTTMNSY